jgi:hypothetical protein
MIYRIVEVDIISDDFRVHHTELLPLLTGPEGLAEVFAC